jgi:hypothetical protein
VIVIIYNDDYAKGWAFFKSCNPAEKPDLEVIHVGSFVLGFCAAMAEINYSHEYQSLKDAFESFGFQDHDVIRLCAVSEFLLLNFEGFIRWPVFPLECDYVACL